MGTQSRRPAPTPARIAMYELILGRPDAVWTVADVGAQLPIREGMSVETIRGTLYRLAEEGILATRHAGNRLQFVLSSSGRERLSAVVERWHRQRCLDTAPVVAQHTWMMATLNGLRLWLANDPEHRCTGTEGEVDPTNQGCRWCQDRALVVVCPEELGEGGVMTMTGALVSATSGLVREAVAAVLRPPVRALVIEASGVVSVDTQALGALVSLRQAAAVEGRSLAMRHREPDSAVGARLHQAGLLPGADRAPTSAVPRPHDLRVEV